MSNTSRLWEDKYRPSSLSDMAMSDENRKFLQSCIDEGEIPHLMLVGPSGIGKTTLAKILVDELDCRFLELNASNERGIDTIREKVGTFAKSKIGNKLNIVFFDEGDNLTPDAQFSCRSLIEQYANQTRFILTANYENKVIDALRSRFNRKIELSEPGVKQRARVLAKILKAEGVELDKETVVSYAKTYQDFRRMIGAAQLSVETHGELHPPKAAQSEITGEYIWGLVEKNQWKKLLSVSKNEDVDLLDLMVRTFWAIPGESPASAKLRSMLSQNITQAGLAPDIHVHFLGSMSGLINEVNKGS